MINRILLYIFILLFPFGWANGEGTKELRPNENNQGGVLLFPSYTAFGTYGAPESQQIKIRVNDLSETVYFGFNNKNGSNNGSDNGAFVPGLPYRIVSPSGQIVFSTIMGNIGTPGNIATWSEAVAGPRQLGNPNGYNALSFVPDEIGDYVLEFDLEAVNPDRLNLDLFDITVANSISQAIPGRIHSQGWQITTKSFNNPFMGKVYPYHDSTAVYEVNFNGMQPYVFVINFNSTGTQNTGDYLADRQSKIGNYTFGEFEVFLNPPDESIYPTEERSVSMSSEMTMIDCSRSEYCFNFSSNSNGYLSGFLDFNQNDLYEPALGEVFFEDYFEEPGNICIDWNGRDNDGNIVVGNFKVNATLGFGTMHLPLYDVEHNQNGFLVNIIRPSGALPPKIFWDDSEITDGQVLDQKVNLTGCESGSGGCHRWRNRGSINNSSQLERQETHNSWWFSGVAYASSIVNKPIEHEVSLSFDPIDLINNDTTVCEGDSIIFFVFEDGVHFDADTFWYNWYFNGIPLNADLRAHIMQVGEPSIIVVEAIHKERGCNAFDTIYVNTVPPVLIDPVVIEPGCFPEVGGSIELGLFQGPPGTEVFWLDDPGMKSESRSDLSEGQYSVRVYDPDFSHCGVDSVFNLKEVEPFEIDSIIVLGTSCFDPEGEAEVLMEDFSKTYEYAWDDQIFGSANQAEGLKEGNHSVKVRDSLTGCYDTRFFTIPLSPFDIEVSSQDEICRNQNGAISLQLPDIPLHVNYNGAVGAGNLQGISAGDYLVEVRVQDHVSCVFDTLISIKNTDYSLNADFEFEYIASIPGSGVVVYFDNLSPVFDTSFWEFGDGDFSYEIDPVHQFVELDRYEAQLTISDTNGCSGIVRKSIDLDSLEKYANCGINLPNVFSPNDDHINDDIGILGYAPEVDLKVFNRWGEVIFRTQEINNRWNGTYRGERTAIGVYPFVLTWKCPDENGRMQEFSRVGDITLVR